MRSIVYFLDVAKFGIDTSTPREPACMPWTLNGVSNESTYRLGSVTEISVETPQYYVWEDVQTRRINEKKEDYKYGKIWALTRQLVGIRNLYRFLITLLFPYLCYSKRLARCYCLQFDQLGVSRLAVEVRRSFGPQTVVSFCLRKSFSVTFALFLNW